MNPDNMKSISINEGMVKKGGINHKPQTSRPPDPKGQGVIKDVINIEFEKWWKANTGRYDCLMATKQCAQDAFEARDKEIKRLKTNNKTLKTKLKNALY